MQIPKLNHICSCLLIRLPRIIVSSLKLITDVKERPAFKYSAGLLWKGQIRADERLV